jgi:hypothetical protein
MPRNNLLFRQQKKYNYLAYHTMLATKQILERDSMLHTPTMIARCAKLLQNTKHTLHVLLLAPSGGRLAVIM